MTTCQHVNMSTCQHTTIPIITNNYALHLVNLTSSFGLVTCVRGIAAAMGPPLGGVLIDSTLDVRSAFYFAAALLVVGQGAVMLVAWLMHRNRNRQMQ